MGSEHLGRVPAHRVERFSARTPAESLSDVPARSVALYRTGIALGALLMLASFAAPIQYAMYAGSAALLCIAGALYSGPLVLDTVEVLLSIRIAWLVAVGLASGSSAWITGSFFSAVIALVAYSATKRCSRGAKAQRYLRAVFAVCFLVMLTQSLTSFAQHAGIAVYGVRKYFIDIPFGNSNSIAMMMSTLGLFLIAGSATNRARSAWAILLLVAAVILSSVGNDLLLAVFGLVTLVRLMGRLRPNAGVVGATLVVASMAMVFCFANWRIISVQAADAFSSVTDKASALQAGDLDATTTNRTRVYLYYMKEISRSPLLGHGTLPVSGVPNQPDAMRPHNLVLEALYQGGPFNLLLYFGACVVAFRSLDVRRHGRAVWVATLFLFLYSMVEPGLFTANKDFVFWTMLGSGTDGESGEARA